MQAKKVSLGSAWLVCLVAFAVILGWFFRVQAITSILPGLASMKVNTALSFLLMGIAAMLTSLEKQRRLAAMLAGAATLIGLMTLSEILFGVDLHIDQLLTQDFPNSAQTSSPGRMSSLTALNFSLLGAALLLRSRRFSQASDYLVRAALVIGVAVLVSYPYSFLQGSDFVSFTGMALHTAFLFVALCVSLIMVSPQRIWLELIFSNSLFGQRGRRLILVMIALPLLVGGLTIYAIGQGLAVVGLAMSIYAAMIIVLLLFMLRSLATFATRDPLTGAFNRTYFEQTLKNLLVVQEEEKSNAVIFIDLDGFKQVNDTLGHAAGDRALQLVAESIYKLLRKTDVLSRIGGDEFIIVLPGVGEKEAEVVVKRILGAIDLLRDSQFGHFGIRASAGVAFFPMESHDPETIIQLADHAMYWAKSRENTRMKFSKDMAENR